jgi:transcriptional regulator with XRE-family HTH domain
MTSAQPYYFEALNLTNVSLRNGFTRVRNDVDVKDHADLHGALISAVITKPCRLNSAEVRFVRDLLRWTQEEFGEAFGIGGQSVGLLENGTTKIKIAVDVALRALLRASFPNILTAEAASSGIIVDLIHAKSPERTSNGEYSCEYERGRWKVEFHYRKGPPRGPRSKD